ncbi:hypothetical protein J8F10_09230 [Gemmata sp. G18]|uniref:Uncharacterized protein n=1 Tax=Gemmata palustris TaxID=2822762 RepID=A0ABS5BP40_9BACT|nr:hypothetical protein [Gemmata palustris]MBP3955463.1 hypothetical protein [Gemmata palustris]
MTVVTQTIRYGWNTIREGYEARCASCGRGFKRTVSTGFNSIATPENRAEYRSKLRVEAQAMSQKPIICNACQKAAVATAKSVELVSDETLAAIAQLETEQCSLDERKKVLVREIDQHRGRLFLHAGETYAQWSCGFGWDGDRFCVSGNRVSKTRPWETTNSSVDAPLAEITYLDDTLENRKAAVSKKQGAK